MTDYDNSRLSPQFARGLAFDNEQIAIDRDVAVLAQGKMEVQIIIPERTSHAAILIGLPTKQIASVSLIRSEQTTTYSDMAVHVHLKSVSRTNIFVNARPEQKSRLILSFESEDEAFQAQRVLKLLVQQAASYEDLMVYESIIDNQKEDQVQPEDSLDYVLDSMGNKFVDANQMSQNVATSKDDALPVAVPNISSQSQRPRSILQSYIESGSMKDNDALHRRPVTEVIPSKNVQEADTTDDDTNGDEVELVPKVLEKARLPGPEEQEDFIHLPYAPQTESSNKTFPNDSITNANFSNGVLQPQKGVPIRGYIDPRNLLRKQIPVSNVGAKIPKPVKSGSAGNIKNGPFRKFHEEAKIPSLIAAANVKPFQVSSRPGDTTSVSALQIPCSPPLDKRRLKQLADPNEITSTTTHRLKKGRQSIDLPGEGSLQVEDRDQLWNEGLVPEDARSEKHTKRGNQSKKRSTKQETRKPTEDKQKVVKFRLAKGTSNAQRIVDKDLTSPAGVNPRAVPTRNAAAKANKRIEKQIESESIADGKALDLLAKDSDILRATAAPDKPPVKSKGPSPNEKDASLKSTRHPNATQLSVSKSNGKQEDHSTHNDNEQSNEVTSTEAHQATTHLTLEQTSLDGKEEEVERSTHVTFAENSSQQRINSKDVGENSKEKSAILLQPSLDFSHAEDAIQDGDLRTDEMSHRTIASIHEPKSFEPAQKATSQANPEDVNELFDVDAVGNGLRSTLQTPEVKPNWPSSRPNRPDVALETSGSMRKTIRFDSQQFEGRNRGWGTGKGIVARLQDGSPKVDPGTKTKSSFKPTEGSHQSMKANISMNKLSGGSKSRVKKKPKPRPLTPPDQEEGATPTSRSAKRQKMGERGRSPKDLQNTSVSSVKTPEPGQKKDPNRKIAMIHFDLSGPRNQGQISAKKLTRFNDNGMNVGKNTERTHHVQENVPIANPGPKDFLRNGELIQPSRPEIPKPLDIVLGEDDQTFPTSLPPPDSHMPERVDEHAHDDEYNGVRTDFDPRFEAMKTCEPSTAKLPAEDMPDKTLSEIALVTREPNSQRSLPAHDAPEAQDSTRVGSTIANRSQSQTYVTGDGSPIHRSQTSLLAHIASSVSPSSPTSSAGNNNSRFFTKQVVLDRTSKATNTQTVGIASRSEEPNILRSEQAQSPRFYSEPQRVQSSSERRILRELHEIKQHVIGKKQIDRLKRKRPDALSPTTLAMDPDTTLVDCPETPRPKRMKQAGFESSISSKSAETSHRNSSARNQRSTNRSRKGDMVSKDQEHRKVFLMLIEMCRVSYSTCERPTWSADALQRTMQRQMQTDKHVRDSINKFFAQRTESISNYHRSFEAQYENHQEANTEVVQDLSTLNKAMMNILNRI